MGRWLVCGRVRAGVAVAVIAGFGPLATAGCFGNFALTRKVYDYNKDVSSDKWVRWLVFLVLNVIPVYGFATMFEGLAARARAEQPLLPSLPPLAPRLLVMSITELIAQEVCQGRVASLMELEDQLVRFIVKALT